MNAPFLPVETDTPTRRGLLVLAAPALGLLVTLTLLADSGYRGGGGDDWRYLAWARCAAEAGTLCVPTDHWATRWTLVAPLAASLAWLGESRIALAVFPALAATACVLLLAAIARRLVGNTAAMVAALTLVATPAFGIGIAQPAIDRVELAWTLAAALGLLLSRDGQGGPSWAAFGGACFALAVASRPSALAAGPLLLPLAFTGPRVFPRLFASAVGFAVPLAAEAAAYAVRLGDPLHPWRLALGHTRVPSSALPAGFPVNESPLFNPRYVDGWTPALGIEVHWTLDPWLNLLPHPALGWTLTGAVALAFAARLPKRRALPLLCAGLASFFLLAYALAIDPKPRMFLPLAALAALAVGESGARLLRARREHLLFGLGAALGGATLVIASYATDMVAADRMAARWVEQDGPHAMHAADAQALALVPGIRAPGGPDAPTLGFRQGSCAAQPPAGGPWRATRSYVVPLLAHRVAPPAPHAARLCQWRPVSEGRAPPPRP